MEWRDKVTDRFKIVRVKKVEAGSFRDPSSPPTMCIDTVKTGQRGLTQFQAFEYTTKIAWKEWGCDSVAKVFAMPPENT